MNNPQPDLVLYSGSDLPVRLGDFVVVKGLLWGKRPGRINYCPGQSPAHAEFEWPECTHVGIALDSGPVMGFPIFPGHNFVGRRVVFIKRSDGSYPGLQPNDTLL